MNQQEQTSTETVLVVNPNSCGGLTGKNWENLYNQIKEIFGENPEVAFSQKSARYWPSQVEIMFELVITAYVSGVC